MSDEIKSFGINQGRVYDNYSLANMIRMNRHFLRDKVKAALLVTELNNLVIKAEKQIESANDNRGSIKELRAIAIKQCNIPDKIEMEIPIFKGGAKQIFEVEININAGTYEITLVSPELNELIEKMKNLLIDNELKDIQELTNNEITVIEKI